MTARTNNAKPATATLAAITNDGKKVRLSDAILMVWETGAVTIDDKTYDVADLRVTVQRTRQPGSRAAAA